MESVLVSESDWVSLFGVVLIVATIATDAFFAFTGRKSRTDTYSEQLGRAAILRGVWGIPYLLGWLTGHFVLFRESPIIPQPWGFFASVSVALLASVLGHVARRHGVRPRVTMQLAWVLIGLAAGHFFWAQNIGGGP